MPRTGLTECGILHPRSDVLRTGVRDRCDQTASAAAVISASTSAGRDANEAWLASSSIVSRACMRRAIHRWDSGWIIRSWVETWYQLGLVLHAGCPLTSSTHRREVGRWLVAMTSASVASTSWQKLS